MSSDDEMKAEYDFSKGKHGLVLPQPGKTRITIWIDTEVLNAFRDAAERECRGYQTAINDALCAALSRNEITAEDRLRESIRAVVREEIALLRAS